MSFSIRNKDTDNGAAGWALGDCESCADSGKAFADIV